MLMLVAMTYNSLLFVALMVGYFIGDLMFNELDSGPSKKNCNSSVETTEMCH